MKNRNEKKLQKKFNPLASDLKPSHPSFSLSVNIEDYKVDASENSIKS